MPHGADPEPRTAEVTAGAELQRQDKAKMVKVAQSGPVEVEAISIGMPRHVFGEVVSTWEPGNLLRGIAEH